MKTLTLIPDTGELDALVDRVLDGDTYDVLLFVPLRVRLYGVQAAEKSTDKGKAVKKAVEEQIGRQIVALTLRGRDKYGRHLASVKCGEIDLAEALKAAELAVSWDGKGPRPVGGMPPPVNGELGASTEWDSDEPEMQLP